MNRFGHGQAPRQYGKYWPSKNKTQFLADTLRRISKRIDELETPNHNPVAFAELRGLQEDANSALRIAGERL